MQKLNDGKKPSSNVLISDRLCCACGCVVTETEYRDGQTSCCDHGIVPEVFLDALR
jgi:hypothetical protein